MKIIQNLKNKTESLISSAKTVVQKITERIILPGFKGYSLFDIGTFFIQGLKEGAITIRASSVAFNMFIAIFPALIFLFSLIPYIPVANFQTELFAVLESVLPDNVFQALRDTINDTIMVQRGGTLSLSLILMIFFSSNGIISMIESFNATYYDIETRNLISKRIVAFLLVIILSFLLIIAISLIAFSNSFFLNLVLKHPELNPSIIKFLVLFFKWIFTVGLFFLAISFLYYLAPSQKSRFKFITPGAIFATFLIIIAGLGFAYYINNFAMYNKLYGSIGTVIVVMLLFYISSLALILGFELNISILKRNQEDL